MPCTLDAAARLSEELTSLRQEVAYLQEREHAAEREVVYLQEMRRQAERERDVAQASHHTTRAALETAQAQLWDAQTMLQAQGYANVLLGKELRRLLSLCHPDRWSAGQEAQALAHDMAAALNGLRQRLEEGRL